MAVEGVQVRGLEEFKRKAAEIPRAMRAKVLRDALRAGAREVRDTAKRNAPVLSSGGSMQTPYRKPGTVKKAISVRSSKVASKQGDVGVFVNVKPLPGNKWKVERYKNLFGQKRQRFTLVKKSQRSAKNPNDPFYWRFLEFGTKFMRARPFLQRGADRLPQALKIFEERIAKWLMSIERGGPIK